MQKTFIALEKNSSSTTSDDRFNEWENQIKSLGQASCRNPECDFIGMNLTDMENHSASCNGVPNFSLFCCIHCRCGFSTKEDHLKHQQNCSVAVKLNLNPKKVENLHFRVIKKMKNKDSSEDHIIQPGPDLPKGQYRRRRAYRAEHKNSWALTLEKFKYVKCIYQNCYFIAMSLEDMISHFGYCNGDGSFAKFVCPYCNGRVTSEAVLLKHIERSHPLENTSIKVEPLMDKSDEFLNLESQNSEANLGLSGSQNMYEASEGGSSTIRKVWENQIDEFGHAFCRKSLCNFISLNITDLEIHSRICDGTPDFENLNCPKCRYRLPTKEDLVLHVPFCKDERVKYFSTFGTEMTNSQQEGVEEDDFEIGPVLRQYRNKWQTSSKRSKENLVSPKEPLQLEINSNEILVAENNTNGNDKLESNLKEPPKQKTRGRRKKITESSEKIQLGEKVKCGKCDFQGSKSSFVNHNLRVHVGLGWAEGEEPVDLNDEKLVIRLVKEAFRLTKKASCDKCDDVKRSVMGFVSHVQNCGKSEEEKIALKVQCPHCEGRYLKYSLSSHIKLCHSNPEEEEEKNGEILDLSGKRRSAIKAASKFQLALNVNEDVEPNQESHYIFYERGSEKIPKLNSKLSNLWYKLKRENKKIPCRHANCTNLSSDVKQAKNHHYSCPLLPEKVFMCELCDFYSVDEPSVQAHVTSHRKYMKQKKTSEEEEVKMDEDMNDNEEDEIEDEEESRTSEEDIDDLEESRKRKRKKENDDRMKKIKFSIEPVKPDLDIEFRLKQNFCRREKIDNVRGIQFYSNGLEMTLREEQSMLENAEAWPELHTTLHDWFLVSSLQASGVFPELAKSVSIRFSGSEAKWKRFERFESDMTEGGPIIFTGGSVRSMSWCKISYKRMTEKTQRQYLAVITAKKFDHLKDMYERSSLERSTLLQIWDCGGLDNSVAKDVPKFCLGIIQDGGEIWDLAWFPADTYTEAKENRLRRLGLLATASENGTVRIWSICDPGQLENTIELPIYTTEPVAILIPDKDVEESCFHLSVGSDGIIAGGFSNGTVAIWNLKNISSPFCKKMGKSKIIRAHLVLQAHKTAITALTFCPSNSRYLSTSGLDRFVKVWDLEFPSVPVEQYNKEYSLDNIWTLNWPSLIYNFDDVVVNFNKGAVKFIKDILTDRHMSTFAMEDTCLSLSFSDWLNTLCGGSITGEVKLRLLKNLIHDQKRHQSTISSIRLEKLIDGGSKEGVHSVKEATNGGDKNKNFLRSYDEINSKFGLVFKDNLGMDKGKPKKPEAHPEEFPIRAVNKIVFNPNFRSFTHIAIGYNCGLVRIQPLKELQSSKSLKFFLGKALFDQF